MPSISAVSRTENASPYERTASRSLATLGMAVEIAIVSKAMIVTSASSATVNSRYADPMGPRGRSCSLVSTSGGRHWIKGDRATRDKFTRGQPP